MSRHEEKSMLAYWAFYIWGAAVILGTITHAALARSVSVSESTLLFAVWTPVVVVGGIGEVAAWLAQVRAEQTPLFGRRFGRFMLSAVGAFLAVVPVAVKLYRGDTLSPAMILFLVSFVFLIYAEVTFSSLFVEAYVLLGIGFVFFLLGLSASLVYVAAGVAVGLAFLAFAEHSRQLEKRKT
jgi:hypothetical protein